MDAVFRPRARTVVILCIIFSSVQLRVRLVSVYISLQLAQITMMSCVLMSRKVHAKSDLFVVGRDVE